MRLRDSHYSVEGGKVLYDGPAGKIIRLDTEESFVAHNEFVECENYLGAGVTERDKWILSSKNSWETYEEYINRETTPVLFLPSKMGRSIHNFFDVKALVRGDLRKAFNPEARLPEYLLGQYFSKAYPLNESIWNKRKVYPKPLVDLICEYDQNDPSGSRWLFRDLNLNLRKIPAKQRTMSMCLGHFEAAVLERRGNEFDAFSRTPIGVRRDPTFGKAVEQMCDNGIYKTFTYVPARGNNPAELKNTFPVNGDLGIERELSQ